MFSGGGGIKMKHWREMEKETCKRPPYFWGGPNWRKIFCKRLEINRPEQSFVPEELANFLTYFVLVIIFISIFSQQNTGKYWNKKVFSYKMDLMELSLNLREKCPYSEFSVFRMRENADQNNSKYGHFLRSLNLPFSKNVSNPKL